MDEVVGAETGARLRAGMTFALLSAMLVLGWQALSQTGAFGASNSCAGSSRGVEVHFESDFSSGEPAISTVVLNGLDPRTCDGETVTITLSGNGGGDPTLPPTNLLSVLDSSLEPCTGEPAIPPVVIAGGQISVHGCSTVASASGAAFASMHDATRLRIEVAGEDIPVGGLSPTPPPSTEDDGSGGSKGDSGSGDNGPQVLGVEEFADGGDAGNAGVPTAVDAGGLMPGTGGPRALMLWTGVLLVLFGVTSLLWDVGKPRRDR